MTSALNRSIMKKAIRILIVEDDPVTATDLKRTLRRLGYEVLPVVASGEEAVRKTIQEPPDLILMDIKMPGKLDGIEAAARIQQQAAIPIIYLSAYSSEKLVERAKLTEPFCYLLKPFREKELQIAVEMALYKHQMEQRLSDLTRRLQQELNERRQAEQAVQEIHQELENQVQENLQLRASLRDRYRLGDMIGKSQAMQELYDLILKAAALSTPVIILGESGTGKELVARTIHQLSPRQERAFIPVNCAGFTESLFESEFFGYHKGAFTGAYKDKKGLFDVAHGGTLFLDEVAELSLTMQAKLLRAIEGNGYIPLGSHGVKDADVRIIAATNKHPEHQVQKGDMRQDFLYRINVFSITVPPLRQRRDDIPLLVDHFLDRYSKKTLTYSNLPITIKAALYTYDWPGNIRELQNGLHRYLSTGQIKFMKAKSTPAPAVQTRGMPDFPQAPGITLNDALEDYEKQIIVDMLEQNLGQRETTAAKLGIDRRTLHRKMKKYGLL